LILAYTDLFLHNPGGISDDMKSRMRSNFSDQQIVELTAGLALFMGFSKIAVSLGGMPDQLPRMEMPTPE
jgi:alkylhydroperoxidase family enzyme